MYKQGLNRSRSLSLRKPDQRGRPSLTIIRPAALIPFVLGLGVAQDSPALNEPRAPSPPPSATTSATQDDFDRLDGTGPSHVKIQVIEWEGNLEIHVTPKGALRGLGIKYEKENKSQSILILAYRLGLATPPLIRRAVLGIPWPSQIQAFRDLSAEGYDKIIFSGNRPSEGRIVPFRLEAPPLQNYPQGHPSSTPDQPPLS